MDEHYSDAHLRDILKRTKNIAVVGVSPNPQRPSYFVARYLGLKGFNVISVNPGYAGKELFGSKNTFESKEFLSIQTVFSNQTVFQSNPAGLAK